MSPQTRSMFGIANLAMLLLFVVGAAVQYNDPDPLRWIAIYLAAACVCFLDIKEWPHRAYVAGAVMVGSVVWGIAVGRHALGKASLPELFEPMEKYGGPIEWGREAVGLLIIGGWMAVVLVRAARRSK